MTTEAQNWYADRYESVYVSRNRWFVAALAALTAVVLQAAALLVLMPLKTTAPFLIKEQASGSVTTVEPLKEDGSVSFSEAVRKYFLARYLILRETYDRTDLALNYRTVELMSAPGELRIFRAAIASNNPLSPLLIFGANGRRRITIESISFLDANAAQLRFASFDDRPGSPATAHHWIATVAYHFGAVPSLEANRLLNPLGFFVTHYRIDQEVAP